MHSSWRQQGWVETWAPGQLRSSGEKLWGCRTRHQELIQLFCPGYTGLPDCPGNPSRGRTKPMRDFSPHPSCPGELDEALRAGQGSWLNPCLGDPGKWLWKGMPRTCPQRMSRAFQRRGLHKGQEVPVDPRHRAEGCGEVL